MENQTKKLVIDFLYLDLNTCERCMATDSTLDEAVTEMKPIFNTLGYDIEVNKINIISTEMANEHGFLSSPTIRVNGNDICLEVKENNCKSCGDICGSDVDCRVFVYEGEEYEQPPKAMIVDGILKEMYSKEKVSKVRKYLLPENLKKFFKDNESPCCGSECDCEGGC